MMKRECLSSKIRNKTKMSTLTTPIQHILEVLAGVIRQEKENVANWKGKIKLSLFADDTILYIEKPKDSNKRLLDLINKFSKAERYKIKIQKSVAFLC